MHKKLTRKRVLLQKQRCCKGQQLSRLILNLWLTGWLLILVSVFRLEAGPFYSLDRGQNNYYGWLGGTFAVFNGAKNNNYQNHALVLSGGKAGWTGLGLAGRTLYSKQQPLKAALSPVPRIQSVEEIEYGKHPLQQPFPSNPINQQAQHQQQQKQQQQQQQWQQTLHHQNYQNLSAIRHTQLVVQQQPFEFVTSHALAPTYNYQKGKSAVIPPRNGKFELIGLKSVADREIALHPRGPLYKALVSLQNPLLLGGDILIKTGQSPTATRASSSRVYKYERSALVSPVSLWPNGIIFYEFDSSVAHLTDLILKVMQQFHDSTCIRFLPRQNNEPDFVRIEALRGCFSYIGRIGGEQTLSLGDGCEYRGTIAHELLHAIGFYHHQNRSDRDDFLEILWENVAKGKEDQFRKMAANENILLNDFDYNSVMLYGPRTFGKTLDKITMKPKREGVILMEVIEKGGLSALDIDSVNKLYKCNSATFSYEV